MLGCDWSGLATSLGKCSFKGRLRFRPLLVLPWLLVVIATSTSCTQSTTVSVYSQRSSRTQKVSRLSNVPEVYRNR